MGVTEIGILLPAFVAGMIVVATHVPLGRQVLAGGIVFIDLAVAQVAGLGVTIADALGFEAHGLSVQVSAVAAALLAALVLTYTERRWAQVQEALIGVLFVLAASIELLVLANNPHGGEHLKDLLVGQILWVTLPGLIVPALLSAAALAIWLAFGARIGRIGFYVLFAVVVTQSVQLVGVYLVFASLIAPALAARYYPERLRLGIGYGVAVGGYVVGLAASAAFDLPTGAMIVAALVALLAGALLLAPRAEAAASR